MLADQLSLRRFCCFGLAGGTPDEITPCRLCTVLAKRDLAGTLFAVLNRQPDAKGLH